MGNPSGLFLPGCPKTNMYQTAQGSQVHTQAFWHSMRKWWVVLKADPMTHTRPIHLATFLQDQLDNTVNTSLFMPCAQSGDAPCERSVHRELQHACKSDEQTVPRAAGPLALDPRCPPAELAVLPRTRSVTSTVCESGTSFPHISHAQCNSLGACCTRQNKGS